VARKIINISKGLLISLGGIASLLGTLMAFAAPAANAATNYLANKCGTQSLTTSQLLSNWNIQGIADDESRVLGVRSVDETLSEHLKNHFHVFTLAQDATINDNGCKNGQVVAVGKKTLKKGTSAFGEGASLDAKYGPGGWSPTFRLGWNMAIATVASRAMTTCDNPISGAITVLIWVRPNTEKAPPPPVTLTATLLKTTKVDGKVVTGKTVLAREWHNGKPIAAFYLVSGTKQKINPRYLGDSFIEVVREPWKADTAVAVKFTKSGQLIRFNNSTTTATPPAPTPPTPTTPTIVCGPGQTPITDTNGVVISCSIVVVICGNIGNNNGGNCNGTPTTPPPAAPVHTCTVTVSPLQKDERTATFSVNCDGPIASASWTFSGNNRNASGTSVTNTFPDNQAGQTATGTVTVLFSDGAASVTKTGSISIPAPPPNGNSGTLPAPTG